jgi:hypothetical protein
MYMFCIENVSEKFCNLLKTELVGYCQNGRVHILLWAGAQTQRT